MQKFPLTNEMKIRICPFHGPFDGIFNHPPQANELTLEQTKMACLIVFENLVYSGIDEDHRKIGCFHALSALTVVSPGARDAMPWLYESVVYWVFQFPRNLGKIEEIRIFFGFSKHLEKLLLITVLKISNNIYYALKYLKKKLYSSI